MAAENKDSPEVIRFMVLFSRLKDWCDDRPEELIETALRDSSVAELCSHLASAASYLAANERRRRILFAAPVDPKFLGAFRDYEERYEHILTHLAICELVDRDPSTEAPNKLDRQREWDYANSEASSQAVALDSAIEFAQFTIKEEKKHDYLPEEFTGEIEDGAAAWKRLCQDTGFDLRGVFRRRALIPFVLVPRDIAKKHGSAEKLSLFTNLRQAHEAFVFGAPYAALALMRSIMESVLRDCGAEGKDLNELIKNSRDRNRLPGRTDVNALHRLRKLSNAILHMNKEGDEGLQQMTEAALETEILSLLHVLRGLIEGLR